jgi:hypothetical protein
LGNGRQLTSIKIVLPLNVFEKERSYFMRDTYKEWNLLLLSEYFSPAVDGDEVWIQTTREELDAFGFELGGANGLLDAIKQGPLWCRQKVQDIATNAKDLIRQRINLRERLPSYEVPDDVAESYKGLNAPTYLPYIALWVLAASESGSKGFYAAVSDLVGIHFGGASAATSMEDLFGDLEHWSTQQVGGKLGHFRSRPLGGYKFVGLAKAQALVTGKDQDGLNRLFKQAGLAPGQELTSQVFISLADLGAGSNYISSSLNEALTRLDVYSEVLEEIFRYRLMEWDGRLLSTKYTENNNSNLGENSGAIREAGDELSLVIKPAFDLDWTIGWRLQTSIEAMDYVIEINGTRYQAYPDQTKSYVTCLNPENTSLQAVHSVLTDATTHDVNANLIYVRDGDENGEGKRSCCFISRDVRVMVLSPSMEFVEGELPISGAAYLLISDSANLIYLENEGVKYEQVDGTVGLPDNWLLVSVLSVENLSYSQKMAIQSLTGGTSDVSAKARIKFVGGCPILRGGAKQYAFYDLPMIEMEAPVGSVVRSEGLNIEEVFSSELSDQTDTSTIRRFEIAMVSSDKHQYELMAYLGEELLARTRLKVALTSGAATGLDRVFSIGRFGESSRANNGVRGALIRGDCFESNDVLAEEFLGLSSWGVSLSIEVSEGHFQDNIACKFLDMIAQKGAIAFGPARDLIKRLAQDTPKSQVHPVFMMLELRSRGHIEIETDQKGHLVRVHATTPSLISLPVVDNEFGQLYGVCGSLRLEHWRHLYSQAEIPVRFEAFSIDRVPVVRLSISDQDILRKILEKADFELVTLPSYQLANWAGTLDENKERLQLNKGYENFRVKNQERLNPQSAYFKHEGAELMKVDKGRQCELFRIDDPVIEGSQVYMLGSSIGESVNFNYIQDSRWGVWLAISAFAKMLSKMGIADACPWPLHYSQTDGSFWLPARMKPPLVIERALCLCSGSGPKQVLVDKETDDDFIRLVDTKNNRKVIGRVSNVYTEMVTGTWLCYQWVPAVLARKLASHLGCELKEI